MTFQQFLDILRESEVVYHDAEEDAYCTAFRDGADMKEELRTAWEKIVALSNEA